MLLAALLLTAQHPFAPVLEERVPALQSEHHVPGVAVALIERGEVVYQRGFGTASAGEEVAITPQTGFNVGSVTKSIVAFGVLLQVESGSFGVDEPAFAYITRWKLPPSKFDVDDVTIARLLSHTAGIDGDGVSDWKPDDVLPPIERSLSGVAGARPIRLRWKPGTRWSYANGGYALLQLMLMEVTGQEFEEYMQAEILEPLGMTRSSFRLSDAILADSATPHHPRDEPTYVVHRRVTSTGGLHTTLEDMCTFALALVERGADRPRGAGVLGPDTVERMLTAAPASGGGWGLGFQIKRVAADARVVGHNGGAWGWISDYWIDPDRGNGYVLLANSTNSGHLHDEIQRRWFEWYAGRLVSGEDSR